MSKQRTIKARRYDPKAIEQKWQSKWQESKLYEFTREKDKEVYYNLVEFPYPSGDLHLGHWFAFVPPDVHARFQKMKGKNVFFTNGFDAFGLPAENAAIKRNIHPRDWTMGNIETMTKQFATMGTMIDWSHKVITCEPGYYRWNQWIFLKMFEKGLAYRGKAFSNWCPSCQTVLANENIEAGKCWRCGTEVVQKEVEQWFLKITEYAEKLLWPDPSTSHSTLRTESSGSDSKSSGLSNEVDWPLSVRQGQNNWIGRSEGVEISFQVPGTDENIVVYTVYPETIYGATYMVLAPEHPLVEKLTTKEQKDAVEDYQKKAKRKSELERKTLTKEKTGVFIGSYCINPVTNQKVPIYISDYVIFGYGTGAVMGVPGSDLRDYELAKKFDIPIVQVVSAQKDSTQDIVSAKDVLEEGWLVNSGDFNGLASPDPARGEITAFLEEKGFAKKKVQYHIHDWSISRQRYWGTPVPVIYCVNCWELKTQNSKLKSEQGKDFVLIGGKEHAMIPVAEKDLPVELPYEVDYTPKGKPPLATAQDWVNITCPKCGGEAKRDVETLDTFFDSSWYYYRYVNPDYDKGPFDQEKVADMMPIAVYFGGAEHTLGHTLYARFFTKFFKDIGMVSFDEFAKIRIQHGVILGPDGNRMSKSKGNVVNPDDVVKDYGSDTVRLYLGFMMPYEAIAPWSKTAISGVYRFLKRIWDLQDKIQETSGLTKVDQMMMHRTIKKVGDDLMTFKFNTAVSTLMQWLNFLSAKQHINSEEYKTLILLLAPFAPHIAEELWSQIGESYSVHQQSWPTVDTKYLTADQATIVVQINGKLRATLTLATNIGEDKEQVIQAAKKDPNIQKHLAQNSIRDTIFVKGKILNFVVSR
ncbi:MAG TPA: class I tRNA ligase family protein [Patescibacteria group bacterium]|nr:class I tRNA ligase family protein [Patescibacteria group bacterium]